MQSLSFICDKVQAAVKYDRVLYVITPRYVKNVLCARVSLLFPSVKSTSFLFNFAINRVCDANLIADSALLFVSGLL